MGWAVILLPDAEGRRQAERVWRAVRDAGFPSMLFEGDNQPHISLTVLNAQDGSLQGIAEAFAARVLPLTVSFGYTGSFGGEVIYLAPEPRAALYEMNRSLTSSLGALAALADSRYLPGNFQPHLTVAFKIQGESYNSTLQAVKASFIPFTTCFDRLAVVKFNPVKVVHIIPLSGNLT